MKTWSNTIYPISKFIQVIDFLKNFFNQIRIILYFINAWDDFLTSDDYKKKHDFLKHHDEGHNDLFKEKPFDIEKTNLLKFEIRVNKHGEYYDFTNSEDVVGLRLIKSWFMFENIQQSAFENLTPILNTRYWTTDIYKTTYFNDFLFYGLRQNILGKVIVNGMSGSSWKFFLIHNVEFKGFKFR